MQEYLESIVKPLLSKPEELKVNQTTDAMGVLFTIDVSLEDMAHLIGKEGQNITAVRRIMSLYGMRNSAKISLKVNEPVGSSHYKE